METIRIDTSGIVIFPWCRCKTCGVIFRDPLEIYPGPGECPACVEKGKRQQGGRSKAAVRRR